MKFEYTIKIYRTDELKDAGIDIEQANNIVYACRTDGTCEIHEVAMEELDNLSGLLNEMGYEGWELIELFFDHSGIVTFWKRALEDT